ncbi:MAG: GtrA family protein [Oscillospiraceae bacterium]|nr:GtrA family protein [Oscillospiraceae bacterium]
MIKKLFSFFCDKSLLIFLLIGGGNTVISMAGSQLLLGPFTVLWGEKAAYWASTALMFALTSIASFILNRHFSFKSKAPLLQSAVRFAIVIAVCYLVSFGLSDFLVPWALGALFPALSSEWVTRIAMLFAQCIFTLFNYVGQRLWAFKE